MTKRIGLRAVPVLAVLTLLAACGGGGGGGGAPGGGGGNSLGIQCDSLAGGATETTENCAGCDSSDVPRAADGSLSSHASLHMATGGAGSIALRATAPAGVVYPAGTPAAVVYGADFEGSGVNTATTTTLTTYLAGQVQETGNVGAINVAGAPDQDVGRRAIGTSLPFDAIELQYTQTGGTLDVLIDVYEFCTSVN